MKNFNDTIQGFSVQGPSATSADQQTAINLSFSKPVFSYIKAVM